MTERPRAVLTLPRADTTMLRSINQLWHIHDASLAVPYDLHPHGEHRANQWSTLFQTRLERVVRITTHQEMPEVKQHMREVVYYRHQGRANRVAYLTPTDLATVHRQLVRERKQKEAIGARAMAESATKAQSPCCYNGFIRELQEPYSIFYNYHADRCRVCGRQCSDSAA
jgi:hypothetical protein